MDPLSIVASSIAIVALRSIARKLPGRMHVLNNEVADLELVLNEVVEILKERNGSRLRETDKANIPSLLSLGLLLVEDSPVTGQL
jgi:hypothetical protein